MNGVLIACLKTPQPAGGAAPEQLVRRQGEMLLDLYRYLRGLSNLWHGELRATWIAKADALWLKLDLVPRRQGVLFDSRVKSRSRPATLPEEAELLRKELLALPMYAKQAAAGFKEWATREVLTPLDPMHEMAYRRSKAQWVMEMETGQRCLDFPEVERYTVDATPIRITGTVYSVSLGAIELRQVEAEAGERSESTLAKASLRVVPFGNADVVSKSVAWDLADRIRPGEAVTMEATLHRCVLSHRVIGAVASENQNHPNPTSLEKS